jgi:hypothetical protein
MSDFFAAPQDAPRAANPSRPTQKTRKGLPAYAGAWYGPQEQRWRIPNPHLPGQPFVLQLSQITSVVESIDRDCCFITITGVAEPVLVHVSKALVLKHAPWAAKKPPAKDPKAAGEQAGETSIPSIELREIIEGIALA